MTATIQVEVGFGSTWQTEPGSITWTDVSQYVLINRGISMQRGASSARGQVDAGTLNLTLLNSDRRFDPTHTTGPYYGDLLAGVPIRVTVGFTENLYWGTDLLAWDADTMTWVSDPVRLFRGTVAGWPQRFDVSDRVGWVPLSCFDGFDKLSRAKIPRSVMESVVAVDADVRGFWPLDETSGLTMNDRSGNGLNGEYNPGTASGSSSIEVAGVSSPAIEANGDDFATVEFYTSDLGHVFAALVDISAVIGDLSNGDRLPLAEYGLGNALAVELVQWGVEVVSATAGTARIYARCETGGWSTGYSDPFDATVPRHIASDINAGAFNATHYVDGVAVDPAGSEPPVLDGQTAMDLRVMGSKIDGRFVGKVAAFYWAEVTVDAGANIAALADAALAPLDGQTTDERIGWILDELGWPTNLRDFDTGVAELGPATFKPGDGALPYLRLIEQSEDGRLFINPDGELRFQNRYWRYLNTLATTVQFTFTDATGSDGYSEFDLDLDDELLVNVARYTRRDGTEQIATNATSVALHGEAEIQRNDLLLTTDAEVLSLAEWAVATQSVSLPRVPKIRVPISRYDGIAATTVLGLDLGHRVAATRTPQGVGTAIDLEFVVDGVRNEITGSGWWWEAYVSPVPEATVPLAIYDTSVYDGTHVYAP